MYSAIDILTLLRIGFPIQRSPDLNLFSGSPKLIAAYHVFHRLLAPRHSPYALCSLTIKPYLVVKEHPEQKTFKNVFQIYISLFLPGGGKRARTADPLRARQVLSQLSYTPHQLRILDCGFFLIPHSAIDNPKFVGGPR